MAATQLASADPYVSRSLDQARIVERPDPVVWGHDPGPLSDQEVARFARDGHLTRTDVFAPDEVEMLAAELITQVQPDCVGAAGERVVYEPDRVDAVRSLFEVHILSQPFADLFADRRLVDVARQLLAGEVYLHQTRINRKPAFVGDGFGWHSDFETWRAEDGMPRPRAVSAVVALTDNTPHNGPLMFFNGSHRWYVTCPGETPEANYRSSLRQQETGVPDQASLTALAQRCELDAVVAPAGSVTFFESNLMHGSAANLSPHPRMNAFGVYNHVDNALEPPKEAPEPRPEFIASRTVRPI